MHRETLIDSARISLKAPIATSIHTTKHEAYNMLATTQKQLMLSKPADWETWISNVRHQATSLDIWHLINPNIAEQPACLTEPIQPNVTAILAITDTATRTAQFEIYKIRKEGYKIDYQNYEKQHKSLSEITAFILNKINADNNIYIRNTESHPWNILRTLKQRLAPSSEAQKLSVEQDYHRLRKGPINQDIIKWVDDWTLTIARAKEVELAEVQGSRPVRDFLLAIDTKYPQFSGSYMMDLEKGNPAEMDTVIDHFRRHFEFRASQQGESSSHSAFQSNTTPNAPNAPNTSTFKGKPAAPKCLCGINHWYADCYYLNPNARSVNWKPISEIEAKVKEALKDATIKARVEKNIKRTKRLQQQKTPKGQGHQPTLESSDQDDNKPLGTFTTMSNDVFATEHPLRNSWVWDSGTDAHIGNVTMKQRFKNFRRASPNEYVISGKRMLIKGYGEVTVNVTKNGTSQTIDLLNVVYIPDYPTNLVSLHKAESKGIYWDHQNMRLTKENQLFCDVKAYGGHYFLEDNTTVQSNQHSLMANHVMKSATATDWHAILGHASAEAIDHLEASAEGVKILQSKEKAPTTSKCEPCALSKSQRIVSRSTLKSEPSTRPFERISFDLIQFDSAYNSDQWVSHIACDYSDFNLVYTHQLKTAAPQILLDAIKLIKRRYACEVVFIRTDGEKALDNAFKDRLSAKGITFEASAPYTPEQNGHAERKGGILAAKARTMRIAANIPQNMWPEVIQTAGYVANRTPMKKHDWKTPFEIVKHNAPNLSHLKAYGCKAYAKINLLPKKQKLAERAHIGHLIGYDSTNIYRVWIPSKHKIIRTRDVIFNERSFYNPGDVDLLQIIEKPMIETTLEPIALKHISATQIGNSDSESEIDVLKLPAQLTENQQGKQIELHLDHVFLEKSDHEDYLPTPGTTPAPSAQSSTQASSVRDTPTDSDEDTITLIPLNLPRAVPQTSNTDTTAASAHSAPNTGSRSNEVSASLDTGNILAEGVGRRRKPRKQAYSAILTSTQTISAFHATYSTFSGANQYYNQQPKNTHTPKTTAIIRLHRDIMPPEPDGYKQLRNHPHAEEFKQAISVEINALQSMKTWEEVSPNHAIQHNKTPIPTRWVLKWTPSAQILADGFTKTLPTQRHRIFVKSLGMVDLGHDAADAADREGGVSE